MPIKFTNNASSTLASSISSTATTITLASGGGALFPSLGASDYFYATLVDSSNNLEIVKVTARVGDTMTVVRGQDGTTSRAYVGGDRFELRPTAAAMNDVAAGTNISSLPAGTTRNGIDIVDVSSTQTLTNKTLSSPSLSSPSMTGTPSAPTPNPGTNNTQVATTAFVTAAIAASQAFPSGTLMLFAQTNAPTGWTKDTTHNDKALRVVNGAAGSGGSISFTSAFASRTPTGTIGSTTLSTAQMPSHTHTSTYRTTGGGGTLQGLKGATGSANSPDSTGGGGSHNHSFAGDALNFAVQYVDVIIASKN